MINKALHAGQAKPKNPSAIPILFFMKFAYHTFHTKIYTDQQSIGDENNIKNLII